MIGTVIPLVPLTFDIEPHEVLAVVGRRGGDKSTMFQLLSGALVYRSLTSSMNLMGIVSSLQYIVRGAVLAAAAIF